MMNKPDISGKGNFHRWLVVVTLLFGFVSFSGYIGYAPHQQQVFKTELVVSTSAVVGRIPFRHETFRKLHTNNVSAVFLQFKIENVLMAHNVRSKTSFDDASKHVLAFAQAEQFFLIRRISQSSEEDLPRLFRG